MIGQIVSHYRITEKLGEGGMGVVYRAHDTKLGRDVALKILPPAFAQDSQRMARFEREAKVLASLNHPHIAQIHGLEEADGTKALVLELVEGETLAERISRGPIDVEEALKIALQICEGLEAAHEKGIIHRDLKPANIKITPEEKVKILDFGLAKAVEGEVPASDLSHSPTLTHEATRVGVIIGTAGYMAPEQARGKTADKKADIWAFGVVLYEMLTGRRTFAGETVSDTLAKVLERESDWEALPTDVPPSVRRLLRRCMTKDQKERLHDIGDARIMIQERLSGSEEESVVLESSGWPTFSVLVVGLAALIAGLVVAWVWLGTGVETGPKSVDRFEIATTQSTNPTRHGTPLTISPDGRRVVYQSRERPRQIYLRDLNQREPTRLADASSGRAFFSPDGLWIGFFDERKLKKISVSGGKPQVLCDAPNPFGGAWGPDGNIIFAPHVSRDLWIVSENGGEPDRLTQSNEQGHVSPVFMEGGKSLLFAIRYGGDNHDLALLDLDSMRYEVILEGVSYAVPAGSGHYVFARADGLYAVAFDSETQKPVGREVPLLRDIFVTSDGWGQFDLSHSGTLVYRSGSPRPSELVKVDFEGSVTVLPFPAKIYRRPRISPDGKTIAVHVGEDGDIRVYLADLESGRLAHFTSDVHDVPTMWSNDGSSLVFLSDRLERGQWKTFRQLVSGGKAEVLYEREALQAVWFRYSSWLPDGNGVLGWGRLGDSSQDEAEDPGSALLFWDKEEPSELKTLVERRDRMELYNARLSPDGKWVVYVANEAFYGGLTSQILITDFPGGATRHPVSGGSRALWSPDGKQIYFLSDGKVMAVDIQTEPAFRVSRPRLLFSSSDAENVDFTGGWYPDPNFDIFPDGRYFLMVRRVEDWEEPKHLNITTNFFEVLKEKVPTE